VFGAKRTDVALLTLRSLWPESATTGISAVRGFRFIALAYLTHSHQVKERSTKTRSGTSLNVSAIRELPLFASSIS
jgi:hypothetical protein